MFTYMTGWRVSEPLLLRREDLDLDKGYAITRHDDNKGNRDDRVPLTDMVVEHLRKIASFEPVMFLWYHRREALWDEFTRIQQAAGIHLPCHGKHECTPKLPRLRFPRPAKGLCHDERPNAFSRRPAIPDVT